MTTYLAAEKVQQAQAILTAIGAPTGQRNTRSALCLLALADVAPATPWHAAATPCRGITVMMEWFRAHYARAYAANTRESVRKYSVQPFVQMGLALANPDDPVRATNDRRTCYQLAPAALRLLRSYGSDTWTDELSRYLATVENLLRDRDRRMNRLPVRLPDGLTISLSPGRHSRLIQQIVEELCPRFTPGAELLYLGDTGEKFALNRIDRFVQLGISLNVHGKMPDVVVYDEAKDWFVLIEAVISVGPVNLKRKNELVSLFGGSGRGLVFITAFPNSRAMRRFLPEISWETEVWVAEQPDHMIHFDGKRFLGPYDG